MIQWSRDTPIYLHRDPVDFRKAINGLAVIVSDAMELPPCEPALFVFCNRQRSQIKVLYWDETGFALWQKRLEQDRFQWPRQHEASTFHITHEQWCWLLRGADITRLNVHQQLNYSGVS